MLSIIARKWSKVIVPADADSDAREICTYGIELALYTFISTAGLFLIGVMAGKPIETILLISIYYTNQTFGGGYHATTHIRCFLVMSMGLIISLSVLEAPWNHEILCGICTISYLYLWRRPLQLHPNKRYLQGQKSRLIRRSRLIATILYLLVMIMTITGSSLSVSGTLGMIVSAVSRMAGVHLNQQSRSAND